RRREERRQYQQNEIAPKLTHLFVARASRPCRCRSRKNARARCPCYIVFLPDLTSINDITNTTTATEYAAADANPNRKSVKPSLKRYTPKFVEESPGPPWVSTNGSSNMYTVPINDVTAQKMIVGRSSG